MMRVDTPPPVVPTTLRPPRAGAALPELTMLRAAPALARPAPLSFGAQLVDTLLRSLTGTTTPPPGLQLQLQWQPPGTPAYAPPPPGLVPAPLADPATALLSASSPILPPTVAAAATLAETLPTLSLQAQLPVMTADGKLVANLSLALMPALRQEHPALAAQLEAALLAASLPALQTEDTTEALRGQLLQFQWADPRALWPLQNLAMRGLLRFPSLAEERDRSRARQRAASEVAQEGDVEPLDEFPAPRDDGGPPHIGVGAWLWFSAGSFLRWLRRLWRD